MSEIADRCNEALDRAIAQAPRLGQTPTPTTTPTMSPSPSFSLSDTPTDTVSPSPSLLSESEEPSTATSSLESTATPSPPRGRARGSACTWGEPTARDRVAQTQRATANRLAEARARALLVETIGEPAVVELEAGGFYVVPSKRWPGTEYHLPKSGYIRIVRDGLWQLACLVSSNSALPWPDVVLSRLKMIQVKEEIVQQKSNRQGASKNKMLDAIVQLFEGR